MAPDKHLIKKVLILEDEPIISKILARTLKADGFEVDTAENGLIAKEKIDTGNRYGLFIFDIRTPIISGIQLYEYMEKDYPELTQKVVFITGDCLNTTTGVFLERVNRPFLTKPFVPAQVLDMVHRAFSHK